jgi:hypothetical protein
MALRIQITLDCHDVHRQCAWWAARLGYVVDDPNDFVEQLLADEVITDADTVTVNGRLAFANGAAADDPDGRGPRMYFQQVGEDKATKNRMHLDLSRDGQDLDVAVAAYVETGATHLGYGEQGSHRWAVMADPEGNEFCIQ